MRTALTVVVSHLSLLDTSACAVHFSKTPTGLDFGQLWHVCIRFATSVQLQLVLYAARSQVYKLDSQAIFPQAASHRP